MDVFEKCRRYTRAKELIASGYYPYFRALAANECTRATINGREMIMVGSNNYLGLTHDPRVVEAAQVATRDYGTSCTGSRFLNGTLEMHEELERRLAKFLKKEAALVFSTGFQANLGAITALVGKGDVIFCDRENHASIIDGCRLSFGDIRKFKHDDAADLERLLEAAPKSAGKLIIVDGVFSMNGSITDLPAVVALAKRYEARLIVDDAHALGTIGATGRGSLEHFGLLEDGPREVDLVTGTFSKSLASLGGFVAGRADVIHFIKHQARSLIFSASCTPASTAAALKALEILDAEPQRVDRLRRICDRVRRELNALGYDTMGSQTPIVPVLIGDDWDTFGFWRRLNERGVFANPVVSPATPPGKGLIRTSYMATHEDRDVDRVIEVFAELAKGRAAAPALAD
ncbi:MAG TPA: pyridoxal phosphate-dependent aminotransferase family protein [Planctomycetota bacterium]|nr:pyridoxal phosphate-dependent aminotransferase family protein [Planctomycetota bacterium]